MAAAGSTQRDGWSSRTAFILAAIGSAVGLGNLWRFPAEAGANGGGAFVLFYIFCVLLIGLPVLLSEVLIGRHGQANAPASVRKLAAESNRSPHWDILAKFGVLGAFMVVSFYCVVGGWVLYYIGLFVGDVFGGTAFAGQSPEVVQGRFEGLLGNGALMVGLHAAFFAITFFFVARGVSKGIEWVATWLMPAFFMLFLAITIYGAFTSGFGKAVSYLFTFDASKLTPQVMIAAVGQAFFSLSLGVAGMITYGAYVGRDVKLGSTSGIIAGADTAVALIAGLCIFPIVFTAGLEANGGPGLMFQSLPLAFQNIPGGTFVGLFFFVMVFFAALTSSIALLEVPTSWVKDALNLPRPMAAALVAGLAFVVGALCAGFLGVPIPGASEIGIYTRADGTGQDLFDVLDTTYSKIFAPISAILTCLFLGWFADKRLVDTETGLGSGMHMIWLGLVRVVCPLLLLIIVLGGLFPDTASKVFSALGAG
ncbi:MAG: sodium-dependent transporter [Erythrobacter sp.]|uniref:sodium-dependent transporter n=1 Tax=Erythrobacter sp. TaxID=1042 RepID=UPI003A8A80D9